MKLSTKARYGMRAMLDLALHRDRVPISLKDIAERQQISLAYLEQIIAPLVAAGLIRSLRGPKGGIWLDRSADQVTLKEIFQTLEGSLAPVECVENPQFCSRADLCVTREVWDRIKEAMASVLESTTLQDLVDLQKKKNGSERLMYYI